MLCEIAGRVKVKTELSPGGDATTQTTQSIRTSAKLHTCTEVPSETFYRQSISSNISMEITFRPLFVAFHPMARALAAKSRTWVTLFLASRVCAGLTGIQIAVRPL